MYTRFIKMIIYKMKTANLNLMVNERVLYKYIVRNY